MNENDAIKKLIEIIAQMRARIVMINRHASFDAPLGNCHMESESAVKALDQDMQNFFTQLMPQSKKTTPE